MAKDHFKTRLQIAKNKILKKNSENKRQNSSSLGAAFLAGINAGLFEDIEMLRKLKVIERSFVPEEREEERYLQWKDAVTKVLTNKLV